MQYFIHVSYKLIYIGCDRLLIIGFKQNELLDWLNLTSTRPLKNHYLSFK